MRSLLATSLLVVMVACGGSSADTPVLTVESPAPTAATSPNETGATLPAGPADSPASIPTTGPAAVTVPSTTASSPTSAPASTGDPGPSTGSPLPVLADGRPATFVGITDEYLAVEVDVATGTVLRTFGQIADAAEVADDPMANVLDSIWRSIDGATTIISECCEPAGGIIHYLGPDDRVSPEDREATPTTDGWFAAPSPVTNEVARTGYFVVVGTLDADRYMADSDAEFDGYPSGLPTWSVDGKQVSWITVPFDEPTPTLATVDLTAGTVTQVPLDWVFDFIDDPANHLEGLARQVSGNFVMFLGSGQETVGAVVDPAGLLVATFPVESGSTLGGYDRTGRFLLYVDGAGTVRWQGLGDSGAVADGFLFASW